MEIAGLEVPVDLRGGQKTGTYLDQQENYEEVAALAKDVQVDRSRWAESDPVELVVGPDGR